MDDVRETNVRLQQLASKLKRTLDFAAPEIQTLHILEHLSASFSLGCSSTQATIAANIAKHAAGWRNRPPSDAAAIVATTLEGLAKALHVAPTPADALAQDGVESELASAPAPSEVEMAAALADAGWRRVGSSGWRRMYTAEAMSTAVAYGTMMAARRTLDETEEARRHA